MIGLILPKNENLFMTIRKMVEMGGSATVNFDRNLQLLTLLSPLKICISNCGMHYL